MFHKFWMIGWYNSLPLGIFGIQRNKISLPKIAILQVWPHWQIALIQQIVVLLKLQLMLRQKSYLVMSLFLQIQKKKFNIGSKKHNEKVTSMQNFVKSFHMCIFLMAILADENFFLIVLRSCGRHLLQGRRKPLQSGWEDW